MRANGFVHGSLSAALLWSASIAHAAPPQPKASAAAAPATASATLPQKNAAAPAPNAASPLRAAEEKLASGDPAVVKAGLDALASLGGDPAANAVAARLRRGLPPQLIEHAIDACARIGRPSVAPVLLELALHRRPQVRRRAIEALGALKVHSAQSALLYALDDPSAEVRDAAVQSLAVVGGARALPALLAAAERGVPRAYVAVGQIATPRDVKAIMARASDGDVTRIKPALQVMLDRKDFPVAGKLALVRELAALGGDGARNHLVQWLDAWKGDGDPRIRQALFAAIKQIDDKAAQAARIAPPSSTPSSRPAAAADLPAARPEVAAAPRGAKP